MSLSTCSANSVSAMSSPACARTRALSAARASCRACLEHAVATAAKAGHQKSLNRRRTREGAQRQRQAGDLGEHAGAQDHQQRQRRKHVRVAHVGDAAVDGPQQRAPARDDHADAGHGLRACNRYEGDCPASLAAGAIGKPVSRADKRRPLSIFTRSVHTNQGAHERASST